MMRTILEVHKIFTKFAYLYQKWILKRIKLTKHITYKTDWKKIYEWLPNPSRIASSHKIKNKWMPVVTNDECKNGSSFKSD